MSGIVIMIIAIVVLGGGYLVYGRFLAKKWGIDPNAKTPAYELGDGVDYVPADRGVVFGHQFASIAGAGPINGPIQAAMFGWIPVLLWILIGGVFFGGVQDFVAMYASVKNKGKSIGYIIELYIGKVGKKLFLLFTWLFSILVVAAFADIVAKTFNGFDDQKLPVVANGSVAMTSVLFIFAAIGLGFFLRRSKLGGWGNAGVAVLVLVACIAIGVNVPIYMSLGFWHVLVFLYVLIACVAPVWALLQPRDYLNSFLLVAMIAASVIGVLVYNPTIELQSFTAFKVGNNLLFPTLFVTIACGAVSGFHALVSSGTASKQIKTEKDMLPISYGAMMMECMLAVIALITVGFMAKGGVLPKGTPPEIFAAAVAEFLTKLHLPHNITNTLILLAISAFGLTSLDSVARIGRLSFQEFFVDSDTDMEHQSPFVKFITDKYVASIATLIVAFALAKMGYANIWPLFGSANQLLSALALIACAVFLRRTKRQGVMLWAPMTIMLAVTFTALGMKIYELIMGIAMATTKSVWGDGLQLVFAVLLLGLGIVVAYQGFMKLKGKQQPMEVK